MIANMYTSAIWGVIFWPPKTNE